MNPRLSFPQFAIVALTVLALALGGSVDLGAQTLLAGLAGFLVLVAPPRGPLARTPCLLAGLLLLLALAAFLPVTSIHDTPWRHYLAFDCHIPPADTRTPQPWLTAQACELLFTGLVWALYVFQQPWDRESRVRAAQWLIFGVAILAAVAVAAFVGGFHVSGWNQEQNRGWFPNRNQTADVLALVGIVNYALIFDRLRKSSVAGYFLLLSLVPIVAELIISYSRAGILLFFGGILLWHLWPRRGKARSGSVKWLALSAALSLVLIAVFLTWGGATLNRLQSSFGADDFTDFRGAIQADALRLSLQSPFLGVGLGNFEPIFAFSRVDSINASRAIHPESDWLWVACEMGWFAPLLLLLGAIWWARRCLPLENKPGESMRLAFVISIFVFLLHGLVDVSGHRLGSLWVALLLAGAALPRGKELASRWTPLLFRGLGFLLLLVALGWFCSWHGSDAPPTTATLARLKARLAAPAASTPQLESTARAALAIAPLDWSLYLQLASLEVLEPGKTQQAQAHFQMARALDPYWIVLFIQEGQMWLNANQPDLCLDAWRDGLRRAGPQAPEAFRQMIDAAPEHSVAREGLAELAMDQPAYLLLLLPTAPPSEASALLTHLLQLDPKLSQFNEAQRNKLFAAWWMRGDPIQLMEILNDHPEWESQTWIYRAQFAARENDFHRACEIAARWVQPPPIPKGGSTRPIADLQQHFKANTNDLPGGLVLYLTQLEAGDVDGALATLQILLKMPQHPRYLAYMEAQLYTGKEDWPSAWEAWRAYLNL